MRLSKYLLNCHKTICGAHFSDRFCIGYLDRFFISISIKIVTCNYRVKCHIVFVSTTFENISNLPSKGTDKHQMQLMNKSMNFSVRAYHAILSLFFFMFMFVAQQLTYSQICSRNSNTIYQESSSVFLLGGSSKKLERSFWR